jgi:hypothetical protein
MRRVGVAGVTKKSYDLAPSYPITDLDPKSIRLQMSIEGKITVP